MRRFVHALLRRLTDDSLADSILGDLDELRLARAAGGRTRAALWFWREVAAIVLHATAQRAGQSAARAAGWRPTTERLAADLRYAVRSLRGSPWYSATVVAVMALGIGLAATVFAVVDGVLFKALPYPDADRLVSIQPGFTDPSARGRPPVSPSELDAWQRTLPDVLFTGVNLTVKTGFETVNEDPLGGAMVHPSFFDVLGVQPLIGGFTPQDFDPAAPRAVLVSYEYWQRRLEGDPSAVGREIPAPPPLLRVRVAGIMPRGFVVPGATKAHLLMPPHPRLAQPTHRMYQAIARLPPGLDPAAFQPQLEAVMGQLAEGQVLAPGGRRFNGPFDRATITPLGEAMTHSSRPLFQAIFAAVLVLVLTACLNVSGLMAARSLDRARDLALRRALGARSGDIVRLQVLEQAVLLAAGAALGVALAGPILTATMALLPHELHLLKAPSLDSRVIAFTVLMLAASVALASIWPARRALQASAWWLANATSAATPRRRSFGRAAVVAGQTAGTMVLVVAGALLVGSLLHVWSNDPGLDAQNLVVADLVIAPVGSSGFGQRPPGVAARLDRFLDQVRRLPGVVAAGGADVLMLSRSWWGVVGFKPAGGSRRPTENVQGIPVTPGFFQAAGLQAIEGRLPTDVELASGAPVAVVGRAFAAAHWPAEPALGRQLLTSVGQRALPPHTIVGVVDDVRFAGWDLDPEAAVYAPYATLHFGSAPVVFVRTAGSTAATVREVVRLAEREAPALRIRRAATAGTLLAETVRPRRLHSWLFGAFAAASLTLISVGLFGLAAMSIARRTREIGVRLALGATRERLVRGLVAEQLTPVVAGLALGGLLSAWAVRSLQSYLYELTVYDARVWLVALIVVGGTALVGTLVPSWRASRLDPMRALRRE